MSKIVSTFLIFFIIILDANVLWGRGKNLYCLEYYFVFLDQHYTAAPEFQRIQAACYILCKIALLARDDRVSCIQYVITNLH